MNVTRTRAWLSAIAVCLTLQASSCSNQVIPLVDQLGQSASGSAQRVTNFYNLVNQIHSQINLDYQDIGKQPPDLPIAIPAEVVTVSDQDQTAIKQLLSESTGDIGKSVTTPYYPRKVLNTRTRCASLLEVYAVKLRLLANSTSASEAKSAAADLQQRLQALGAEVSQLDYANAKAAGSQIGKMGSFVSLAGMGAQALVSYFRKTWVNQTIQNSDKQIDDICDSLIDDSRKTSKRVENRLSGLQREYQLYFASNEALKVRDEKLHQRYMAELEKISNFQNQIQAEDLADLYETYHSIHRRLLQEVSQ